MIEGISCHTRQHVRSDVKEKTSPNVQVQPVLSQVISAAGLIQPVCTYRADARFEAFLLRLKEKSSSHKWFLGI
jgi:hypothetical protein